MNEFVLKLVLILFILLILTLVYVFLSMIFTQVRYYRAGIESIQELLTFILKKNDTKNLMWIGELDNRDVICITVPRFAALYFPWKKYYIYSGLNILEYSMKYQIPFNLHGIQYTIVKCIPSKDKKKNSKNFYYYYERYQPQR